MKLFSKGPSSEGSKRFRAALSVVGMAFLWLGALANPAVAQFTVETGKTVAIEIVGPNYGGWYDGPRDDSWASGQKPTKGTINYPQIDATSGGVTYGTAYYTAGQVTGQDQIRWGFRCDPVGTPYACGGGGATITIVEGQPPTLAGLSYDLPYMGSGGQQLSPTRNGVIRLASQASKGVASVNSANNTFNYYALPDQIGIDSFTVIASNSKGDSAPATITVNILPPPLPTLVGGTLNVAFQASANFFPQVRNDGRIVVAEPPSYGLLTVGEYSVTYKANNGFVGQDSFKLTARNPTGEASPVTVDVTVAPPPIPVLTGGSLALAFNTAGTHNFAPTNGGALALASAASHGTVTISGGRATYAPDADYIGPDSFGVTGSNPGGTSAVSTVAVTVAPPPIPILTGGSLALAFNSSGTHDFAPTSGGTLALANAASHGTVTISGGRATYVPDLDFIGSDSFGVTGTNLGGTSAVMALSVTVAPPPLPTLTGGSIGLAFNEAGSHDFAPTNGGILAIADAPAHGTATISGGHVNYVPAADYIGPDSFSATATNLGGTSAPVTLNVTVSPPAAPGAGSASLSTPFETSGLVELPVTGLFTAINVVAGPQHGGVVVAGTNATYTPEPGYYGPDQFSYQAVGLGGPSGTATVSVNVVRPGVPTIAAPAAVKTDFGQSVSIPFTVTGIVTTTRIDPSPAHGTATINGAEVNYRPNAGYSGTDTVTVVAAGPGGDAVAKIEIAVAAEPEVEKPATPPVEKPGTISQDGQAGTVMRFRVAEGRADVKSVELVSQPARGVAHVEVLEVVYAPPSNFVGEVTFDYRLLTEAGASEPATLTATVHAPAQEAPVKEAEASADTPASVELTEGVRDGPFSDAAIVSVSPPQAGTVELLKGAAGASAPKAGMIKSSAKIGAAHAPEEGGGSFKMKFTPADGFYGEVLVRYSLTNRFAALTPGVVRITVDTRSDPTRDPKVVALVSATARAANSFGTTQIANASRRMENARSGARSGGTIALASARPVSSEEPFIDQSRAQMLAELRGSVAPTSNAADVPNVPSAPRNVGPVAVWTGGVVELGEQRQKVGNSGFDFATSGVSLGSDVRVRNDLIIGAGVGYGRSVSDLGEGAEVNANGYSAFVYTSYQPAPLWFVDGVVGINKLAFKTQRSVASGAVLQGERDGQQWFASISAGLDLQYGKLSLTPYGRFEAISAALKGYSETGDDANALRFAKQAIDQETGALGLRGSYRIFSDLGVFEPTFRGEYHWSLKASDEARIGYANGQEGERYSLPLTSYGDSRGLIGLGLRWQTMGNWLFTVEAEANHANGGSSSSLRISGAGTF